MYKPKIVIGVQSFMIIFYILWIYYFFYFGDLETLYKINYI